MGKIIVFCRKTIAKNTYFIDRKIYKLKGKIYARI